MPLCLRQVLEHVSESNKYARGVSWSVRLSYVELYNEAILGEWNTMLLAFPALV